MNLLQETIADITRIGKTPEQIIFIGSEQSGHQCTWNEFKLLANVDYDQGYGAQKVATDLIIVFSDGTRMWRGEYDGSEWWEYALPFSMPAEKKKITRLLTPNVGWENLGEFNK